MLDLGVDLNAWPWVWLSIAVIFALLEVTFLGGSFVLAPFAVSAFISSILGFYDVVIEVQWAVFVIGGAVMWIGFYRWAKTFLRDNVLPPGVGANRLVGMVGIITVAVEPQDASRLGRMLVAGEVWSVTAHHDEPLSVGTKVRITSVQGTRAVVESMKAGEADPTEERP